MGSITLLVLNMLISLPVSPSAVFLLRFPGLPSSHSPTLITPSSPPLMITFCRTDKTTGFSEADSGLGRSQSRLKSGKVSKGYEVTLREVMGEGV